MIRTEKLSKHYGPKIVLADVSFALERGQRAALVGQNGTGKSTLLKILAGLEEADAGKIDIDRKARIGYLPQDTSLAGQETIDAYVCRITGIAEIEHKLDTLDPNSEEYQDAYATYLRMEGYSFDHRLEIMMAGFGLTDIPAERVLSSLSSGQKTKVVLIGLLLQEADLLLLDEPTNNLDLPALIWLEDFMLRTDAACILVSHDRRFIDRTATKVFELDEHTHALNISNGTYSDYLGTRRRGLERQKQQYAEQQDEIARLKQQASDLRQRSQQGARFTGTDNDKFRRGFMRDKAGGSGRKARTIEKRINQMDLVDKPIEREPLRIPLVAEKGHGERDIQLAEVIAGYPGRFTLGPVSLRIPFGSRVGILGLNGTGKSTLLKTITGVLPPISGSVAIGSGLRLGDMMQEHDSLPREEILLEFLGQRLKSNEQGAYSVISKAGLDTGQAKGPISALSPGSRARLLISIFAATSTNALVLDEPTNHLDLEAMEALEEALEGYEGTVILVSHDRYFIDRVSLDEVLLLADGKVSRLENYEQYLSAAEEQANRLLRML